MLKLGAPGIRGKNTFYVGPSSKKAFDPATLFENGEQGLWLDPSDLSTMFQDAAGTIPVTAVGQPVGLILDKSKGLVLGAELALPVTPFTVYRDDNTNTLSPVITNLEGGKTYLITATVVNTSPVLADFRVGANYANTVVSSTIGNVVGIITCGVIVLKSGALRLHGISSGTDVTITSVSVREVKGNHVYQTTSASRPILQQKPLLAPNLLPTYDFRTWSTVGTPSPLTANSFTTSATGGVRTGILKPNTSYVVELDVENTSNVGIYHGANANTTIVSGTRRKVLVQVTTDTGAVFYLRNAAAGTTTVYSIKVQEITGYRTDQNYIEYDKVDDKLITTLPAQLTDCTVIRSVPDVGTQILTGQTISATYEDNTNHCGLIVINRALTPSETSAITSEFNKRAGV